MRSQLPLPSSQAAPETEALGHWLLPGESEARGASFLPLIDQARKADTALVSSFIDWDSMRFHLEKEFHS